MRYYACLESPRHANYLQPIQVHYAWKDRTSLANALYLACRYMPFITGFIELQSTSSLLHSFSVSDTLGDRSCHREGFKCALISKVHSYDHRIWELFSAAADYIWPKLVSPNSIGRGLDWGTCCTAIAYVEYVLAVCEFEQTASDGHGLRLHSL